MMKRLLAGLLALAMVMSFVPAVVSAEPEAVTKTDKAGTHTADHKCEECGSTDWKTWSDGSTPDFAPLFEFFVEQVMKIKADE